jgi:hypothetical protein
LSELRLSDDALREAFQAVRVPPRHECPPEDLDRIRQTLAGAIPADDRRALVERLASEPGLAEAWRVANHLRRDPPAHRAVARPPLASWWQPGSLVAAAALAALAVAAVVLPRHRTDGDTLRGAGNHVIESRLADGAALPRNAFRLQWSEGPPESRYQVRVATEDLRLLASVADLSEPELVVEEAILAHLVTGSRIFWQVEARLPDGERVVSPTFVVRLQSGP